MHVDLTSRSVCRNMCSYLRKVLAKVLEFYRLRRGGTMQFILLGEHLSVNNLFTFTAYQQNIWMNTVTAWLLVQPSSIHFQCSTCCAASPLAIITKLYCSMTGTCTCKCEWLARCCWCVNGKSASETFILVIVSPAPTAVHTKWEIGVDGINKALLSRRTEAIVYLLLDGAARLRQPNVVRQKLRPAQRRLLRTANTADRKVLLVLGHRPAAAGHAARVWPRIPRQVRRTFSFKQFDSANLCFGSLLKSWNFSRWNFPAWEPCAQLC